MVAASASFLKAGRMSSTGLPWAIRRSISMLRERNLVIFQAWRESRRQMTLMSVTLVSKEVQRADSALSPRREGPASRRLISTRELFSLREAKISSMPSEEILFLERFSTLRVLFFLSTSAKSWALLVGMPQLLRSRSVTLVLVSSASAIEEAYLEGFIWKEEEPAREIDLWAGSLDWMASRALPGISTTLAAISKKKKKKKRGVEMK